MKTPAISHNPSLPLQRYAPTASQLCGIWGSASNLRMEMKSWTFRSLKKGIITDDKNANLFFLPEDLCIQKMMVSTLGSTRALKADTSPQGSKASHNLFDYVVLRLLFQLHLLNLNMWKQLEIHRSTPACGSCTTLWLPSPWVCHSFLSLSSLAHWCNFHLYFWGQDLCTHVELQKGNHNLPLCPIILQWEEYKQGDLKQLPSAVG